MKLFIIVKFNQISTDVVESVWDTKEKAESAVNIYKTLDTKSCRYYILERGLNALSKVAK